MNSNSTQEILESVDSDNSSYNNEEEKEEILSNSTRNTLSFASFASLPSDGSFFHQQKQKQNSDQQQSDFLDSLQILCISVANEIKLINQYLPDILINSMDIEDSDCKYQILEFIINTLRYDDNNNNNNINMLSRPHCNMNGVELVIKCDNNYPKHGFIDCRVLKCPLLSESDTIQLLKSINNMAQQYGQQQHNCMLRILIYLENRLNLLNMNVTASNAFAGHAFASSNTYNSFANIMPNNGFFASLNCLHFQENQSPNVENENQSQNEILPSSFTALQDIQTTKTRSEKQSEYHYAAMDNKLLCPKMCAAKWGANGQLIFFNNILIKKGKIKKECELTTFHSYNQYIEACGGSHVHSAELHSIRKHVFANHFDEDEDRFADEFIVGFSLISTENNKTDKRYKNAYLHRSVSSMHQQHHHSYNAFKEKYKNNNTFQRRSKRKICYQNRQGNARIFFPGIVGFVLQCNFSKELVKTHKLAVNEEYDVCLLCLFNSNQCKLLGLNRLSKRLKLLSNFLKTEEKTEHILLASPYQNNYIAKFIEKVIDEFYLHCDIQAIAIISCLLRQSQFAALLFYNDCNELNGGSCYGHLLECCVAHYLKSIKYRVSDNDIADLDELENFHYLLNKQKKSLRKNDNEKQTCLA